MSPTPENATIVNNPAWAPIIDQVQRQGNARNLPRPAGYENERGGHTGYAMQRTRRADGSVRCYVFFRLGSGQSIHIGSLTLAGSQPPERRKRILQPGQTTAGRIVNLACGRQVRVIIDAQGLPLPVPVEMERR